MALWSAPGGVGKRDRSLRLLKLGIPLLGVAIFVGCLLAAVPSLAKTPSDEGSTRTGESTELEYLLSAPADTQAVGGEVIVAFKSGVSDSRVEQVAESHDASVLRVLPVASRMSGTKIAVLQSDTGPATGLLEDLSTDPYVAQASLNYKESTQADREGGAEAFDYIYPDSPDDSLFSWLWGLHNWGQEGGTPDADIDAVEAWYISTGSPSVVIADIDSGVDYTHQDLAPNMWTNAGEVPDNGLDDDGNGYVDDWYGIDTFNYDSDPMDDLGHGTHTSGTIAAAGDNGIGVTGVSWSTRIMALKFLGAEGWGSNSGAIEAIYYTIDQKVNHGVNVAAISASWGGGGDDPVLEEAIAAAGEAGIIFVAAAGNAATDTDQVPFYPACYELPNIISVGASDRWDLRADFSNYGATSVDLFAPGQDILSTVPGYSYFPQPGDRFFDDVEDGQGDWTVEGTASWAITGEQPFGASNSWSDSPGADYGNNVDGSIVTGTIDLTAGPPKPVFGFLASYSLEESGDFLYVEMSGDNGATWRQMTSRTGESGWTLVNVRVPDDLLTTQFRARLRLVTNDANTSDGVYVDYVGIGEIQGGYESWGGTSMATPHVSGAIALLAAEYPADDTLTRMNRVRSGVDLVPQLASYSGTGGRLNLASSLDPDLDLSPWVVKLSPRSGVVPGTSLRVEGYCFGGPQGRVLLSDGSNEVEAAVTSWSDQLVEAIMPDTSNGIVIVETAAGARAIAGKVSAWRDLEPSIFSRDGNAVVAVGNKIYSFGGYTMGGNTPTDTAEYYDVASDAWFTNSKMNLDHACAYAAAAEIDGLVYVLGGYDPNSDKVFDSMQSFDPATGVWTTLAPLPTPLIWPEAVVLDGKIWVFGGLDGGWGFNLNMYVYDPAGGSWSLRMGPAIPRFEGAGLVLDGRIYLFGGNAGGYLASAEVYDPDSDSWSSVPVLPFPLARMGATEYGGKAYLIGGTNTDWWNAGTDTVLRFDPQNASWTDLSSTLKGLAQQGVHSAPAVSIAGKGIYSMNGMNSSGSSKRLQFLADSSVAGPAIFGSVYDYLGLPVPGALVRVRVNGFVMAETDTDSQGHYEMDAGALHLGQVVDVIASAPGFFSVTHHGTYDELQEEVCFWDFRDDGNDQGDRRLPEDTGGIPPWTMFDGLLPEPLTVSAVAGQHGSAEPISQQVRYGQDAVIEMHPDPGYHVECITVDGLAVTVTDPLIITDVRAPHQVEVAFSDARTQKTVGQGWNLVAGNAGSDTGGVTLFAYDGSYYSMPAALMEPGYGYWGRFTTTGSVDLACSGMPVAVHLEGGWNLIGNSGHRAAALPEGLLAFAYANGGYVSTGILEPGQGAWVKAAAAADITLTPILFGVVRDMDGEVVAGAMVEVAVNAADPRYEPFVDNLVARGSTDAAGRYRVSTAAFPLGTIVDVSVTAQGYTPVTMLGPCDEDVEEATFADYGVDGDRRMPVGGQMPPQPFEGLLPD